jgi:hypothetical protein
MGNTECCRDAKDVDYVSQVVDQIKVHPSKEETLPPVKEKVSTAHPMQVLRRRNWRRAN